VGWFSNDLTGRTGCPPAGFGVSGYAFVRQRTQHILFQGFGNGSGDGRIHELWFDGGHWHHNDISGQSDAPPAAVGVPSGYAFEDEGGDDGPTQHAIYQGRTDGIADGTVHEIWWGDDKSHHQLSSGPPGPMLNGPFGYAYQGDQYVAFEGRDGHVDVLVWDPNFGWQLTTVVASAPLAVGTPFAYLFAAQRTEHIVYTGGDNRVHELWRQEPIGHWTHNDLTAASGAPTSADYGELVGYGVDATMEQFVHYRGTDQHLHQLRWDAAGWHHLDLTTSVGGTPAASGSPVGYVHPDGTLHVFYLGVDGHVHEYWRDATGWHCNPLLLPGLQPAYSSPTAYVMPDQSQHVVYIDSSRHVIELYWLPG
jgi:hypothetical protein